MPAQFTTPSECPVCGEDVPRNAKACPGCGADERSGWNEETTCYDGLNLPDEAYNDEQPRDTPTEHKHLRAIVIVVMIGALLFLFVF